MYNFDVIKDVVFASSKNLNLMNERKHVKIHRSKDAGFLPIAVGQYVTVSIKQLILQNLKKKSINCQLFITLL